MWLSVKWVDATKHTSKASPEGICSYRPGKGELLTNNSENVLHHAVHIYFLNCRGNIKKRGSRDVKLTKNHKQQILMTNN